MTIAKGAGRAPGSLGRVPEGGELITSHAELQTLPLTSGPPRRQARHKTKIRWHLMYKVAFDVQSNRNLALKQIYERNEKEKIVTYNDRGMSQQCAKFNNLLAQKIARKRGEEYADVIKCIRTKLRFAMLKSTLIALRGFRGKQITKEVYFEDISFNLLPQAEIVE